MFNEDNDLLFSNSNNDITNNINDTGMDLPPELGEIKELSDAPIAKAPTMEVLSPMNIIPDEFDGNSILDNYDAGIINSSSVIETNEQKEDIIQNSPNNEVLQEYNNFDMNYKTDFLDFPSSEVNFEKNEIVNNIEDEVIENKQPVTLAAEVFERVVYKIKEKGYDIELEKYDNDKQIKLEIIIKK